MRTEKQGDADLGSLPGHGKTLNFFQRLESLWWVDEKHDTLESYFKRIILAAVQQRDFGARAEARTPAVAFPLPLVRRDGLGWGGRWEVVSDSQTVTLFPRQSQHCSGVGHGA